MGRNGDSEEEEWPRLRTAGVFAGASLLLGLLETVQVYVRNAIDAHPIPASEALLMTLPRWLLLGALAPAVAAIAARVPLGLGRWRRAVAVHVPAAVAFAVLHLVACVIVYGFLLEGMPNRFPSRLSRLLTVYFAGDLLVYGALVGTVTAIRYGREARMRAIASSQLEARFAEARLEALRAQLNPHFLFNALNATSVMAMKGERDSVVRMLGAIADLLRMALDRKLPHEVPLSAEMAMVDGYVAIQTARFPDRLTVRKEIESEALDGLVPSMFLQPLVENAVEHGVAARPGSGLVSIHARREGTKLLIEVRDTGPGFGSRTGRGRQAPEDGIGLGNTRARLAHLYGSSHHLETGNIDSGGAFVLVTIPWHTVTAPGSPVPVRASA
jgi:two-component system, LytTR family, sensor kinase